MKSFLDQDLYKLTMGQAAMSSLMGNQPALYRFVNRDKTNKFDKNFLGVLRDKVGDLCRSNLAEDEKSYLGGTGLFRDWYLNWLSEFRYNPYDLDMTIVDNQLELSIRGDWEKTIYWEVPLMALISETYFETMDKNWTWNSNEYEYQLNRKAETLNNAGIKFAEFGTRRRRSFDCQDLAVNVFKNYKGFVGTSNIHLAQKYGVPAIGTVAHEFFMANSVRRGNLDESIANANVEAMENWIRTYRGKLGIALTDTFTTKSFLKTFDSYYARLFDGVRQDSGNPFDFGEMVINHYLSLGINPLYKTIVFSDSLDVEKALRLQERFAERINCIFAIGTHFTNDFLNSPALKIVIKLFEFYGFPVVKVSDDPSKASGEAKMVNHVKRIHNVE